MNDSKNIFSLFESFTFFIKSEFSIMCHIRIKHMSYNDVNLLGEKEKHVILQCTFYSMNRIEHLVAETLFMMMTKNMKMMRYLVYLDVSISNLLTFFNAPFSLVF